MIVYLVMECKGKINIRIDTIMLLLLALLSLELNLPYALDQLNFHHSMPLMGFFSNWICPGGVDQPLVILGNKFGPYLLMVRTITLAVITIWLLLDLTRRHNKLRSFLVIVLILTHVLIPQIMLIRARTATENHALAHDGGTIQMEESMKMILSGKNPYTETFHGTPLENWRGFTNNVVYHLPYMPGAFLYSLPAYMVIESVFDNYDQRMFHLMLFLACFGLIACLCPPGTPRLTAWILFGLNPFFVRYFLLGANDITIFFWILLSMALLKKKRLTPAFIALAAGCAVKQFAWFFVPFMAISAFSLKIKEPKSWIPTLLREWKIWLPGTLFFCLTVFPFIFWDPVSFFNDTFRYGSGGLPTSYPMQGFHGYGFASILLFLRIVPDGNAHFPFVFLQLITVLPLFAWLWRKFGSQMDLSAASVCSSFMLLVFMFFSRYLHGNFIGFIMFWPILTWAMHYKETSA
ncbi:hypothetical protein K8T06_03190 [bacterium]|nr:hypothetical protein [bacterium]